MKYCKNCGAKVPGKFCLQCGTPAPEEEAVVETAAPVQSAQSEPKGKGKLGAHGILGILGLSAIPFAEATYLFYSIIGLLVARFSDNLEAFVGLVITAVVLRIAIAIAGSVLSIVGLALGVKKEDASKLSKILCIIAVVLTVICMVWVGVSSITTVTGTIM